MVGIYKLPSTIFVSAGCLGKSYKISIGGLDGIALIPRLHWSNDEPRILDPAMEPNLQQHVEHYATGTTQGWEKWHYWGSVNEYNPAKQTIAGAHVGAILLVFKVDPNSITYSDYLHGRGHPEGKDVQALFDNIDEWFERSRTWIGVARDQDIDPVNPIQGVTVKADGLQVLTVDGGTISLPAGSLNMTVRRKSGEHIKLHALRKAFALASSGALPSDAHVLLRDSRAALWRGYFRRAVIDAGSATEVGLADFNNRVTHVPLPTRSKPTLGWYVREATISARAGLPSNTMADLVSVRNAAIHQNKTPTRPEAELALRLAKQIVRNIAPLPF